MIIAACDEVGFDIVEKLVSNEFNIQCVILTSEDRGGYNSRMVDICKDNDICFVFDTQEGWSFAKSLNSDIGLLAWWPRILNETQLGTVSKFWLNTHPGYLPWNRGAHPYFWSIIDGSPFGVSIELADSGIDTGPIVARKEIPVDFLDTGQSLYDKAKKEVVDLLLGLLLKTSESSLTIVPIDTEHEKGSFHLRSDLEPIKHLDINKDYTLGKLIDLARASTFGGASQLYFNIGDNEYQLDIKIKRTN